MALGDIEDAVIDAKGRFKYILIKLTDKSTKEEKVIVRGHDWAGYHVEILDDMEEKLKGKNIECDCPGGGRILHEPEKKHILVYGYSQGFGRADHTIAVELLKKKYPDYTCIEFSNDGY